MTERCSVPVSAVGILGSVPCSNKPKLRDNGKWLCWMHTLEAYERRDVKMHARIEAGWQETKAEYASADRLSAAQEGVVKALEDVQWVDHGRPHDHEPEWSYWCPSCHWYKPDGHRPAAPRLPPNLANA